MPEDIATAALHEKQLRAQLERASRQAPQDYARLKIVPLPQAGTAMAYYELGDPRGRPLLCLHGLSVTGFFFDAYDAQFAAMGVRAIAPCMLGGIHVSDDARTVDGLADQLLALMDALGAPRFDVIGFSWGTLPELALVARAPQRIGRAGFLGAMLPVGLLLPDEVAELKPDVALSLRMAGKTQRLHRALMWGVCKLPVSALVNQFKDENLSAAESQALVPGTAFHARLSRELDEGRRTGSRFFTQGWRMFLDAPGYALKDLAASRTELRLYVGERDNVHLPSFSYRIAAGRTGAAVQGSPGPVEGPFRRVSSQANCSIWMADGAGRMACMLYFKAALDNLMAAPVRALQEA